MTLVRQLRLDLGDCPRLPEEPVTNQISNVALRPFLRFPLCSFLGNPPPRLPEAGGCRRHVWDSVGRGLKQRGEDLLVCDESKFGVFDCCIREDRSEEHTSELQS